MEPTIKQMGVYGSTGFKNVEGDTAADKAKLFLLPETYEELSEDDYQVLWSGKVVAWNGHEFEVLSVIGSVYKSNSSVRFSPAYNEGSYEPHMPISYPIDLRTNETDWDRATGAKPNEANDAWLPEHGDEDYMLDHEIRLTAAVDTAFRKVEREAEQGYDIGLALYIHAPVTNNLNGLEAAKQHKSILFDFIQEVRVAILAEARTRHIGYYHQNPHEAHIHEPLHRAIVATIMKWQKPENMAKYTKVRRVVEETRDTIANKHSYETRWDKEARLAAEKEAEETD